MQTSHLNSWPTTTPKGDVVVDVDEGTDGGGGGGAGKVMGLALSDDVNTSSALIINCCNNKKKMHCIQTREKYHLCNETYQLT